MESRGTPVWLTVVALAGGAVLGLALGAGLYTALVLVLERAGEPLVELKGFAWNLVPLSTLGGAVLGGWAVKHRQRRGSP